MSFVKEYLPVPQSHQTLDASDQEPIGARSEFTTPRYASAKTLVSLLLISLGGNLLWAVRHLFELHGGADSCQSLYAGLSRDVPLPYRDDTIFSPGNRTLSDAAWEAWVVNPGIVALPHEWVKAKMLPRAQRWPWDGDKGIYLLNGYHNLHCLVIPLDDMSSAL